MIFANRISIDRFNDHFVIHFSAGASKDAEPGEVTSVVLPLTVGVDLSLKLFAAMVQSMMELQTHFITVQATINDLNKVAAQAKAKQAEAQKQPGEAG